MNKIHQGVTDHIENVVLPHAKYTRKIEALLLKGSSKGAEATAGAYLKAHPENIEAKFYAIWLPLIAGGMDGNVEKAREAAIMLSKLEKAGCNHPQLELAMGFAYEAAGDKVKARKYAKKAIEAHVLDKRALELSGRL